MLFAMPSAVPPFGSDRGGGTHRRERLRDRGVDAAVHDPHRLTHPVDDRDPPGEVPVLAGRIDDDAQHADQAVLEAGSR